MVYNGQLSTKQLSQKLPVINWTEFDHCFHEMCKRSSKQSDWCYNVDDDDGVELGPVGDNET